MRSLYIGLALAAALGGGIVPARSEDPCAGSADGALCIDDEDPCTTDLCAGTVCQHAAVPNRVTCDPVLDAYRRTLGLQDLVAELETALTGAPLADASRAVIVDGLAGTGDDIGRASDALAGRLVIPPPAPGETLALARARAAFGIVRATPVRVRAVFRTLRTPSVRAAMGSGAADLAHRTRFLYRSTNQLKRELRRLQRVSGVFAR